MITEIAAMQQMKERLKAPFPYFGGKSRIAGRVWEILGDVDNYIEPFAGSLAVLLARPTPFSGVETVNDFSCHVVNTWRAIQGDPNGLAQRLVSPCSEVDTEAQHNTLVQKEGRLREDLGDPDFFDTKLASFWIKGANEWIGSGWAAGEGPWLWSPDSGWTKAARGQSGTGINRQLPHLGNAGTGINRQLPHLGNAGKGINRQLPHLGNAGTGQYEARIAWVSHWLVCLRDRLCHTRIACGDFERVLSSSVLRVGREAGVFLDPPYEGTEYVYGSTDTVSLRVRQWCVAHGRGVKVVIAGRGSEHDQLLDAGWRKEGWAAGRGYSNQSNTDRHDEALWISPACSEGAFKEKTRVPC